MKHWMSAWNALPVVTLALLALLSSGCSSVYYSIWETVGVEKRDLLRSSVEGVQDDQQEVSEQFASTLDRIRTLYDLDGGALEHQYDELSKAYEQSVERSNELRSRMRKVEDVAEDLFQEWEAELGELSSADLQRQSEQQLQDTQERFSRLESALQAAELGLDPVLEKFKDQVLFLKHNLNAKAVGALANEVADIEADVESLVADLERSIAEADVFIRGLPQ